MAIHKLRLPFAQMRGTLHSLDPRTGITLSDAPTQGHNARRYCPRQPPPSPFQVAIRTHIGRSAKAWSALPAATAALWRNLAYKITRNNALGFRYRFTGIAVWNQVQLYRQGTGLEILDTLPDFTLIPPPVTSIVALTTTANNFHIELNCNGFTNQSMVSIRFSSSSPNAARFRQPSETKFPYPAPAFYLPNVWNGLLNSTLAPAYVTQHLAPGEYLGLHLTPLSPQFLSGPAWFIPLQLIS